ncbi:hypothetical protein INR49_008952 [Caranx melampygus]|nr:hypothetical protein INR49_008952 [Caranx melampygus]
MLSEFDPEQEPGVGVGRAHPQSQLQQSFQSGRDDVVHRLLQLLLRQVHEVHEEIALSIRK